jgi:hypothetical protein
MDLLNAFFAPAQVRGLALFPQFLEFFLTGFHHHLGLQVLTIIKQVFAESYNIGPTESVNKLAPDVNRYSQLYAIGIP